MPGKEKSTAAERKKRKEEGRLKKKQLIEQNGGKRPRKETVASKPQVSCEKPDDPKSNGPGVKTNHPQNKPFSWGKSGTRNHRFGRVMSNVPSRNRPRFHTLSVAIPGSIVANCQTKELRTLLCGQIARAATIYSVDEIVVFDDKLSRDMERTRFHRRRPRSDDDREGEDEQEPEVKREPFDPHSFMARILQYCECPQYMRRHFFPMAPDLQFVGLLAPADAPHHVRAEDECKYREGVVLEKKGPYGGSLVNCGIRNRPVLIGTSLQAGIRCTVKIDPSDYKSRGQIRGEVVSPAAPREDDGSYWGYSIRMANSLKAALDECPFEGGYDLKIGTSERGSVDVDSSGFSLPKFKHAIFVVGGVAGIEECVDADESLKLPGSRSDKLFDMWVNICKLQGSRTIRTEEALLIGLAKISPFVQRNDIQRKSTKQAAAEEEETAIAAELSDAAPSDESSEEDS